MQVDVGELPRFVECARLAGQQVAGEPIFELLRMAVAGGNFDTVGRQRDFAEHGGPALREFPKPAIGRRAIDADRTAQAAGGIHGAGVRRLRREVRVAPRERVFHRRQRAATVELLVAGQAVELQRGQRRGVRHAVERLDLVGPLRARPPTAEVVVHHQVDHVQRRVGQRGADIRAVVAPAEDLVRGGAVARVPVAALREHVEGEAQRRAGGAARAFRAGHRAVDRRLRRARHAAQQQAEQRLAAVGPGEGDLLRGAADAEDARARQLQQRDRRRCVRLHQRHRLRGEPLAVPHHRQQQLLDLRERRAAEQVIAQRKRAGLRRDEFQRHAGGVFARPQLPRRGKLPGRLRVKIQPDHGAVAPRRLRHKAQGLARVPDRHAAPGARRQLGAAGLDGERAHRAAVPRRVEAAELQLGLAGRHDRVGFCVGVGAGIHPRAAAPEGDAWRDGGLAVAGGGQKFDPQVFILQRGEAGALARHHRRGVEWVRRRRHRQHERFDARVLGRAERGAGLEVEVGRQQDGVGARELLSDVVDAEQQRAGGQFEHAARLPGIARLTGVSKHRLRQLAAERDFEQPGAGLLVGEIRGARPERIAARARELDGGDRRSRRALVAVGQHRFARKMHRVIGDAPVAEELEVLAFDAERDRFVRRARRACRDGQHAAHQTD